MYIFYKGPHLLYEKSTVCEAGQMKLITQNQENPGRTSHQGNKKTIRAIVQRKDPKQPWRASPWIIVGS